MWLEDLAACWWFHWWALLLKYLFLDVVYDKLLNFWVDVSFRVFVINIWIVNVYVYVTMVDKYSLFWFILLFICQNCWLSSCHTNFRRVNFYFFSTCHSVAFNSCWLLMLMMYTLCLHLLLLKWWNILHQVSLVLFISIYACSTNFIICWWHYLSSLDIYVWTFLMYTTWFLLLYNSCFIIDVRLYRNWINFTILFKS